MPTDVAVVKLLYSLVKAREYAGKPMPTVAVVAVGDLDIIVKSLDRSSRTA